VALWARLLVAYFLSSDKMKFTISSAMLTFVTICRPFHPGWLFTSTIFGPFGPSRMSTPAILHPTAFEALTASLSWAELSSMGAGLAPWL